MDLGNIPNRCDFLHFVPVRDEIHAVFFQVREDVGREFHVVDAELRL